MNHSIFRLATCLLSSIFLFSCNSNEIGDLKDVDPDAVYFDYKVSGEEGNDEVTVMLQYRFGGSNGTTLVLEDPSKVELDGVRIATDSSKMTGAFYERQVPVADFTGKHVIVFTGMNKKQYREEFDFQPLSFATILPDTIQRDDLSFEVKGLEAVDYVRVLLTDTFYASKGINRVDTVRNGRILLSGKDLETVVNGPVQLELMKENDRPVRNGTAEGGNLSLSYTIRKAFVLK